MDDIGVLVVDDSALMRNLISRIVDGTEGLKTVDKAMNGRFALEKIPLCNPDIIVLDIEMPVMTGIEFLKERKQLGIDIPVVILSSIATKGATVTMQCLELGASDFLTKPTDSDSSDVVKVASRLRELLLFYGQQYARKKGKNIQKFTTPLLRKAVEESQTQIEAKTIARIENRAAAIRKAASQESSDSKQSPKQVVPMRETGRIEIIAIGISTGGPNALREVFAKIDPRLKQPILVVQHMPVGFTEEFAASLNSICPLEVKEAKEGDILKSGRILIAPGNKHIVVERKTFATVLHLSDAEQRNGHRPSADVLFESIAKEYQNRALGIVMTGMGKDGAEELAEMRRQGAHTLGQDEESSVVYGMPKVAWELGGVQKQVSLSQMAAAISTLAKDFSA